MPVLPSNLKQIKSLVQFTRGSSLVWDTLTLPLPSGVVSFSIDDGAFKIGDGVTLYPNLPTLFKYSDLVAAQGGTSALFDQPIIGQEGKVVVISFDSGSGLTKYAISTSSLNDILTPLSNLEATNSVQDATIAQMLAIALSVDVSINTGVNGNIISIQNGRYSDSGYTAASIQAAVQAGITYIPGSHLMEPVFYTTASKAVVANKMALYDGFTYYVNVPGINNNVASPVIGLTCANPNVVVANVSGSLFSVKLNTVCGTSQDKNPIILVASCADGTGHSTIRKAIVATVLRVRILEAVYGGTGNDYFRAVAVDSYSNIFCVGSTLSEGTGQDALVVKFDNNLNILARIRYGGSGLEQFNGVCVDSSNNIICVGSTLSEGTGQDALVVKFDTNLTILTRKIYGGAYNDTFWNVTVDTLDNIFCIGWTYSEGTSSPTYQSALIVKFDTNLNMLARKVYGGANYDSFNKVVVDSSGNIICVGTTFSESAAGGNPTYQDALVVKFDLNLNILARKIYGGAYNDKFNGLSVDPSGNIICTGYTYSEGTGSPTYSDALIVKFDSNLNILARKIYGGAYNDTFWNVTVDTLGNIFCIGWTYSEGTSSPTYQSALIVKFDTNLNLVSKKVIGGGFDDDFSGIALDSAGNIICVGSTGSSGSGGTDAFVVKIPFNIPSGSITGTVLTGLTISDSNLTLNNSSLTIANSTLTLSVSNLTLAASTLSLATSGLTLVKDTLN